MIVAVNCDNCDEEQVSKTDLVLYRINATNRFMFGHRCYETGVLMLHIIGANVAYVMERNGIWSRPFHIPKEFTSHHYGDDFIQDDIITFQELLEDDVHLLTVMRRWTKEAIAHREEQ